MKLKVTENFMSNNSEKNIQSIFIKMVKNPQAKFQSFNFRNTRFRTIKCM